MNKDALLEVRSLTKIFRTGTFIKKKEIVAVEDVSFTISVEKPTVLTLAGESGSGKSTTALMTLGFIKPTSGVILYRGKDIWKMRKNDWARFRREVQAVFQDPYSTFNPLHKVDRVLTIPIRKFNLASTPDEEHEIIAKALESVGLRGDEVLGKYPRELSGGQRQRIMLARAFLLKPNLIIADEPVSMVDASLRANILNVMLKLKRDWGISFLYITHDLSTARYISDDIIIMYRGSIMERGPIDDVVLKPLHPYVQLLVESIPEPDPDKRWERRIELPKKEVETNSIKGCKFYHRCAHAQQRCAEERPRLTDLGGKHQVACHLYQ
ncbi:MAG: ABC transporter ATP-binding protein [Thermoproteota archaeon]|nr:MAG: ABC transporter ATP-binding protein [Candidatus Korarchaeota archaeon]